MKKLFFVFSFFALSFAASAENTTPKVDEACTACATSETGGTQCAASPDGCKEAIRILLEFLE